MKERQIFWIVAVTAVLSMIHAVGTPLTYSQNDFIHGLGNLFYNNPIFRIWQIIAFFLAGYFLVKKVPLRIALIPLIFAFIGLPFIFMIVKFTDIGGDVRNPLEMSLHLGLATYSFVILQEMRKI